MLNGQRPVHLPLLRKDLAESGIHILRLLVQQGTEAAAVTEITMLEATATPDFKPPRRVYFIADRPFLFVVRDLESNVTLFAGVFNKL